MSQMTVEEKEKGFEKDAVVKLTLWAQYFTIFDENSMGGMHPELPSSDWDLVKFEFFYTHIFPNTRDEDEEDEEDD
eukprot:3312281-Alexandrium_andersonii.AAC.1